MQGGLLELLNRKCAIPSSPLPPSSKLSSSLAEQEKVLAFNYASQALNNSFFLSSLAPQDRLRNPTPLQR